MKIESPSGAVVAAAAAILLASAACGPAADPPPSSWEEDSPLLLWISPDGAWLTAFQTRQLLKRNGSYVGERVIRQWIYRVSLKEPGARPAVLFEVPRKEDGIEFGYSCLAVLDDGTVYGFRKSALDRWDPAGARITRALPALESQNYNTVQIPGDPRLVVVDAESGGGKPWRRWFLDPSTLKLGPAKPFEGLWLFTREEFSPDGRYLFTFKDSAPPTEAGRQERPRAVRVDLKTGKADPLQLAAGFRIVPGTTVAAGTMQSPERGKSSTLLFLVDRYRTPPDFRVCDALAGWYPRLSLGGDRFLLGSVRGFQHRVADLKDDAPKLLPPFELKATMLNGLYFSPARQCLIVRGLDPYAVGLVDLSGKALDPVRFEPPGKPADGGRKLAALTNRRQQIADESVRLSQRIAEIAEIRKERRLTDDESAVFAAEEKAALEKLHDLQKRLEEMDSPSTELEAGRAR